MSGLFWLFDGAVRRVVRWWIVLAEEEHGRANVVLVARSKVRAAWEEAAAKPRVGE